MKVLLPIMKNKSLAQKAKSLTTEFIKWSQNDFGLTTEEQYNSRLNICKACKSWDPTGFNNTGTCLECGCSSVVKLKLTTTECPLKKWIAITP